MVRLFRHYVPCAVAVSPGVLLRSAVFFALPPIALWRSNLLLAMILWLPALGALRLVGARALGGEAFRRRVLVLGAGPRAARLSALCARPEPDCRIGGLVAIGEGAAAVPDAVARRGVANLADHAIALGAGKVVLALDSRRNALPLADLLRVRATSVGASDLSSFIKRETGRVDLRSVKPSWLILFGGFSPGRVPSSAVKRLFDIAASLLPLLLTAPLPLVAAIAIRLEKRGPVFYRQRRVGRFGETFDIPKFRPMRTDAEVGGRAVWAAKDDPRVTRVGRLIRKLRIEEIAQAWSVLKCEMSVVGPRPLAAAVRRGPGARAAFLRRAAHGEAGHHRLGADRSSLSRERRGRAMRARVRPLLGQLLAVPRPFDPAPEAARGAVARGRALSR